MKTIAIYCPMLTGGGAEKVAGMVSMALEPYVDKVYFFLLYKRKITYEYSGELVCFDFDRIDEKYSRYGRIVTFLRKALAYLHLPKRMQKTKRELGIDCTISFLDFPSVINILSRAEDKIVVSVRSPKSPQKQKDSGIAEKLRVFIYHTMLRRYLNKADVVVPASYGIGEDMTVNFGVATEKIRVIYNFLNKEKINEIKSEVIEPEYRNFFDNHFTYLSVGRLGKEKNPESILHSFAEISRENADARLVFVGDGVLRGRLAEAAEQMGIQDKVLFIPYTSNPYKYMANSNVLVTNSLYEGFPNVLIEAMCCGCPPVSVDCYTGPREIIGDITTYETTIGGVRAFPRGILFERGKLSDAMKYALENREELRKMAECAKLYAEQYSNEAIVRQWVECVGGVSVEK